MNAIKEINKKYGGSHGGTNLDSKRTNFGGDMVDHGYHEFYHKYFNTLHERGNVSLLEVGIYRGGGLVVWSDYFEDGSIYGVDIGIQDYLAHKPKYESKGGYSNNNVTVHKGDSTNKETWDKEIHDYPLMDIIIDDGHHVPKSNEATLDNFWDKLKPGGIYVIEDIRTPYLSEVRIFLNERNLTYETYQGKKGEYIIYITK